MIHIRKAVPEDITILAKVARTSFLETYSPFTPREALDAFMEKNFNFDTLHAEINTPYIHYFLIFKDETLAGYTKIELNIPSEFIEETQITKLDRIYVLKEFYGQKLGANLFNHTADFCKTQQQQGMWLYVLIYNERALRFYRQNNFQVAANCMFKVSETHSNPNYVMHLSF
jgi:GNAT superfamily N-acetyltransferase